MNQTLPACWMMIKIGITHFFLCDLLEEEEEVGKRIVCAKEWRNLPKLQTCSFSAIFTHSIHRLAGNRSEQLWVLAMIHLFNLQSSDKGKLCVSCSLIGNPDKVVPVGPENDWQMGAVQVCFGGLHCDLTLLKTVAYNNETGCCHVIAITEIVFGGGIKINMFISR